MGVPVGGLSYPKVVGEEETLAAVVGGRGPAGEQVAGRSIARFGDGEFKIAAGGECVSQARDPNLTHELAQILHAPPAHCLIGIPTMDPRSPKYGKWERYIDIYPRQMARPSSATKGHRWYSAFISRPDSAPWIDTPQFFDTMQSLWEGQEVALVGCGERSLQTEFLLKTGAKQVDFILCPRRDAYAVIDQLEARCLASPMKRVLLCAGPTATCLAVRLAARGKHAIDLGHVGMFWRGYANPKRNPAASSRPP